MVYFKIAFLYCISYSLSEDQSDDAAAAIVIKDR